ncbi:MAG: hypothetical protein HY355_03040 [Armatimonadetes bacterium]|nr:hypothetical protein [Armatimonadota bacterium]
MARTHVILLVTLVGILMAGVGYAAGKATSVPAAAVSEPQPASVQPAQAPQFPPPSVPGQPPTMREFVPLPIPGDQQPFQLPGNQQGECEPIILFYHNGQLYQLRPGPGPQIGPGRPGVPPEFYRLEPYQGPAIPGLPFPAPDRGPGFTPVNPRS